MSVLMLPLVPIVLLLFSSGFDCLDELDELMPIDALLIAELDAEKLDLA